jgi:rsbT co-antagonist protein RsbR
VVLLPLVGAVDAGRAERIMASLLESIDRHGARVVLLDVTGVPFLDAAVAGYLVRAAQASRLMGAEVALVGLNARTARSVVDLGLDLQGIPVLADVQSGLEHALRVQGLAILKAR